MASASTSNPRTRSVRFEEAPEASTSTAAPVWFDGVEDEDADVTAQALGVERDPESWAGSMPAAQGLYSPEHEKDACGVGFVRRRSRLLVHR